MSGVVVFVVVVAYSLPGLSGVLVSAGMCLVALRTLRPYATESLPDCFFVFGLYSSLYFGYDGSTTHIHAHTSSAQRACMCA